MNTVLKNTWTILDREEKKKFVLLILLGIIISIADIASLVILLWIINFYIQPGMDSIASSLPTWLANKESIALIAVFSLLFTLKNIVGYLVAKSQYDFTGRVAIRISAKNLVQYQRVPFAEFVSTDSSAFIRRIAFQPFDFSQHVLSGIQQIITQLALIFLTITAIVIFDARLFLLLLVILLPPVVLVFFFIKRRLGVVRKHIRDSNERSFQYLLDALKGYVEANIYQRTQFFLERFIRYRRKFSSHLFDSLSIQNMPARIIEIFAVLGLFILIIIAKSSGNNDNSLLITIGAFMAAAYKIIPGIVKVINLSGQIRAYEFAIEELDFESKSPNDQRTKSPVTIHSIECKEIGFLYEGRPVLEDVSFALSKGDFLGISGISGKGKTTLLNILLGFLEPGAGKVLYNGNESHASDIRQYWPSITYVRQQPFLIYDTIVRNITLEEDNFDNVRLENALRFTGLDKLVATFPEGLDKIITENGKNISGGQQQRIAMARALYKNADLLLLDEPFNELDEASTIMLLEKFKKLSVDKIIILITHDRKSFSYCTKTISLDEKG